MSENQGFSDNVREYKNGSEASFRTLSPSRYKTSFQRKTSIGRRQRRIDIL